MSTTTASDRVRDNLWQAAVTVWAVAAVLAHLLDVGAPLQPLLVFSFVLVGPGAAATTLVGVRDGLVRVVLSVAMSTVAATIVAQVLLAVGWWSPTTWLVVLALAAMAFVWPARAPLFEARRRASRRAPARGAT